MASARRSFPANEKQQKRTLDHFTHPHLLTREAFDQNNDFVCNACNTLVSGVKYHCKQCNFNIHEYCADCPEYLNTYLHRNHQLELMWDGSESIKKNYGNLRPCGVCGDQVKGLFYICSSGAEKRTNDGEHFFFIHPLCSKFPSQVRHPIHENHPLKFKSVSDVSPNTVCAICRCVVSDSSWSYRCDPCRVNIHIECVTLPFDNSPRSPKLLQQKESPRSPKILQQKESPRMFQQQGSPKMYPQKRPVDPLPASPTYGGYSGTTPFTQQPHNNYHPNPPPPHNYSYCHSQPPPQPYGPSPSYNNYHPPPPPPNNDTGGKKNRVGTAVAGIFGKIAVGLLVNAVVGEITQS